MKVARHEMPGKPHTRDPSSRERCDPGHQASSDRLTYRTTMTYHTIQALFTNHLTQG